MTYRIRETQNDSTIARFVVEKRHLYGWEKLIYWGNLTDARKWLLNLGEQLSHPPFIEEFDLPIK